ncbi:uncharacterized protein EHS24_000978 [Apiotrichum porosum]|uniref:Uncharacterized protein n=1 Tax=Apiotrichum porosum TaxID=105984 RepID=A0A427YBG5_9TREE|nr:uncharacterized protein EHS24_000978 [Apiotrichum porosum]RSH88433.1 hypothetical protein EHS24_000978 [Apiotrichum porosum]
MAGAMSEAERKERRKVTNANSQKKNKHLRAKKKAIRKAGISDAQKALEAAEQTARSALGRARRGSAAPEVVARRRAELDACLV